MRRRRRLRYAEALFGGVLCTGAFLPLGAQEVDRYPLSALERLPILTPAPEPVLRIGLGDSEDEIIGRLVRARLLPGGGVALLDRTDRRGTRIFNARGRLLHRIAREGEGPGEVQLSGMHDLQVEEDGSVLFFSRGRHVIRYSPEGELDLHLTLREMGPDTTPFGLVGRLQGGDFILLGWAPALPVGPEPILRLDTLEVFRVDAGSGELERIDCLPGYNRDFGVYDRGHGNAFITTDRHDHHRRVNEFSRALNSVCPDPFFTALLRTQAFEDALFEPAREQEWQRRVHHSGRV